MASNSLLGALGAVFEEGPNAGSDREPLTLNRLIRRLESDASAAPNLASQLPVLRGQIGDAACHLIADLQQDRDEELEGYMHELLAVYQELESALERSDLEEVQLPALKTLLQRLRDWNQAILDWNTRPVQRCPRCGREGESSCPICHLETLYNESGRTTGKACFGPEYTAVYQSLSRVIAGEATLNTLWAPIEHLEQLLRRYQHLTRRELTLGLAGEKVTRTLKRIALATEQSLAGLVQMRSAAATRQALELHEGWSMVFEYALEIQDAIPELARALGGQAKTALNQAEVQDSLLIDFD